MASSMKGPVLFCSMHAPHVKQRALCYRVEPRAAVNKFLGARFAVCIGSIDSIVKGQDSLDEATVKPPIHGGLHSIYLVIYLPRT